MLFAAVAIFAVIWGVFLEYMIFHSEKWARTVDPLHDFLRPYGLSWTWIQRCEKGIYIKIIVGLTTFISLVRLAFMLVHVQWHTMWVH
jgi:hypothetical protein